MRLRHHPRFGGTPTLPERNLRGPNYHIYTPASPEKTRQLGKSSLAAQQPSNPKPLYPYRHPSPHFDLITCALRTSTLQFARGVHFVTYWICDPRLEIRGNIWGS
ncbi:hypothetical protein N7536_011791 [Penicillium majusculum]|nr:hypothetical protein N7536_011791 [Penicillium majusculum]